MASGETGWAAVPVLQQGWMPRRNCHLELTLLLSLTAQSVCPGLQRQGARRALRGGLHGAVATAVRGRDRGREGGLEQLEHLSLTQ